jgi:hypothetical protein
MKVTAIIPDAIVEDVKKLTGGKNITESLIVALEEWVALKRVRGLNDRVREAPLEFKTGYSAGKVRSRNRNR